MKFKAIWNEIILNKLIERYELDPIIPPEETGTPAFYFVIDIFKNTEKFGYFFPKVYRRESFEISPSNFKAKNKSEKYDEVILVQDTAHEWESLVGGSAEEVLQKVLGKLEEDFSR